MEKTPVVTCFLRNGGTLLLLRRSDAVGSYRGQWGAVAGHAEGDPAAAARAEIREETGLDPASAVEHVRTGETFAVTDEDLGVHWVVHPFLFDADRREITPNEETEAWEWIAPTELFRRETVPDLWTAYDRVRPTVESIAGDPDHGSAWLSIRSLEVLRDAAGLASIEGTPDGEDWAGLVTLAEDLLAARPSMAVVRNRVHRAMATASASSSPAALERAGTAAIEAAIAADRRAAAAAADLSEGRRVATLSRSGTVEQALRKGAPAAVLVAESRPGREGVGVAERLADAGRSVTLTTDAGLPFALAQSDADVLLVGADAIHPDGSVRNKVGTRGAALSAAAADTRVVVAAATDKVDPHGTARDDAALEPRDPAEVYDGDRPIQITNDTFDVTPSRAIDAIVTERGELRPEGVAEIAATLRELAAWQR